MAPEKIKGLAAGDVKQKATIGVVVVIVLIVIWQVIGLFGGGGGGGEKPAAAVPQIGAKPGGAAAPTTAQAMAAPAPAPEAQVPKQSPVQFNAELMKLQQETEAKYVAALNQLQMLKLQKEIEDVKQGIASAKLATVTSENSITDLLTRPSSGGNVGGGYNAVVAAATAPPTQEAPPGPPPAPALPIIVDVPYVVMSISQHGGRWTAVLSNEGKLYNVVVGDTLPSDGSVVVSINQDGIVLEKDTHKRKISIISSI